MCLPPLETDEHTGDPELDAIGKLVSGLVGRRVVRIPLVLMADKQFAAAIYGDRNAANMASLAQAALAGAQKPAGG